MSTNLNSQMEMFHLVTVHPDGTVSDSPSRAYVDELGHVWTADGEAFTDEEEAAWIEDLRRQGWEPLIGFTGQCGYRGAVRHPSEFIGGGLERHILDNPGTYVAVPVEDFTPMERGEPEPDAFGWAVLRKIEQQPADEPEPLAYSPVPGEPFRVLEPLRKSPDTLEKERLFPNGVPLTGDLTPEQRAWLSRR